MKKSSLSRNESQRLCVTFGRGEEVKYISHLDIMRLWVRALRRAGMPLSYSEGFNPRPRIAIAAPLAVGVMSEGELLEIFMERRASCDFFARAMGKQLPDGIQIFDVKEIWPGLPSLQSQVRFAEYKVELESERGPNEVAEAVRSLLGKENLPWQHSRGKEVRHYDLRALIEDIWIADKDGARYTLGMKLRNDSRGSGRPERVALA
ncbi:MAG: TIGR03936 family radical SAM-associated protein, partial [Dehalococcoidia bacterium]